MKKKLQKTKVFQELIKVMVWDIVVGKKYYSYHYRYCRGDKCIGGEYDTSHSRSVAFMRKHLENGGAVTQVIENNVWVNYQP